MIKCFNIYKKTQMDKEIEKLANEISFRLLATKDHPDYEWLKEIIKKWKNTSTEEN